MWRNPIVVGCSATNLLFWDVKTEKLIKESEKFVLGILKRPFVNRKMIFGHSNLPLTTIFC